MNKLLKKNSKDLAYDETEYLPMLSEVNNEYIQERITSTLYKFDIDEDFDAPSQIRALVRLLDSLEEQDTIIIRINHWGGCKFTMLAVINALTQTKGHTIAEVIHASSAGSFIALSCDDCYTVNYGEWYLHEVQSGTYGDSSYQHETISFTRKTQKHLFDDIYKGFLSEDEIEKLHAGSIREFNFDYLEGNERLKNWREFKMQEQEKGEQDLNESN